MRRSLAFKVLLAGFLLTAGSFGTCLALVSPSMSGTTTGAQNALGEIATYGFFGGLALLAIGGVMAVVAAISRRGRDGDGHPG